jgi:hypothetical protein
MVHNKLLTAENLLKRGIQGPSRCTLCKEAVESSHHLFFECNFAAQVWELAYQNLYPKYNKPSNWKDLFTNWKNQYI